MTPFGRIRVVAMVLLVAALMPPGASVAGGPSHTGKALRWRTLTFSDETTTSKCIGKPVTPICAVETFEACFKRSQIELCRMAYLNGESETFHLGYSSPESKTEYTIIKYQTIRHVRHVPANIRRALEREGTMEKPGDVRVDITSRSCRLARGTCAGEPTQSFVYFIRHAGHRWLVYDYSAYDQPE